LSRKYRNYSDKDIVDKAKEVYSIAGLLRALGLVEAGGNYNNLKISLKRLDVDTSHWTGQAWCKDEQLKDWPAYKNPEHLKKNLIKARGRICSCCGASHWLGK
jgi:hypothetical protein